MQEGLFLRRLIFSTTPEIIISVKSKKQGLPISNPCLKI
jgi:hypothetical protein